MNTESKWVLLINAPNLVNPHFVRWDLGGMYQCATLVTGQPELGRNWTCDPYISPESQSGLAQQIQELGGWSEGEF